MDFRTLVSIPRDESIALSPASNVMLVGSCFADHVGQMLQNALPSRQVCVNPNGTLYNPLSICRCITSLLADKAEKGIDEDGYFVSSAGEWRHWDYATAFSAPTREALRDRLKEAWQKAKEVMKGLDMLFVTLSTDHVYQLVGEQSGGRIVANCHKQPSRMFDERVADADVTYEAWRQMIGLLKRASPKAKVVFTLSPYRYAKYGMHENALSKARLLLFIDKLEKDYQEDVCYFPAYEIINDELRDYRFYTEDMLHPSAQAVAYVWERFSEWIFTPSMHDYVKERTAIIRDMQHRPLHPESEAYQHFLKRLEEKRAAFEKKWKQPF